MGYPNYVLSSGFLPLQAAEEAVSVGMSGWRDEQKAILSCKSAQAYKGKEVVLIESTVQERLVKEIEAFELKEK